MPSLWSAFFWNGPFIAIVQFGHWYFDFFGNVIYSAIVEKLLEELRVTFLNEPIVDKGTFLAWLWNYNGINIHLVRYP